MYKVKNNNHFSLECYCVFHPGVADLMRTIHLREICTLSQTQKFFLEVVSAFSFNVVIARKIIFHLMEL